MNKIIKFLKKPEVLGIFIPFFILLYVIYCSHVSRVDARNFYNYEEKQINHLIRNCGTGYYLATIPISGIINKYYSFSKIHTLVDDYFVNNVKEGNVFYKERREIDECTYKLVNNVKDTKAMYYGDIASFPECETIQTILSNSHRNINFLGFSVVKNYSGTIIVYVLSNTDPNNTTCKDQKMIEALEDLARKVKSKISWRI